jgi:ribonuclease HII
MDWVVGVDEVGRGAWAGPVTAGAVLLGPQFPADIEGRLKDSKLLSRPVRQQLSEAICQYAAIFGVGWASAGEVDAFGLTQAVRLAMERAVAKITEDFSSIIIDGNYNFLSADRRARTVIKADQTVPAVSAASIIAKVARDDYMNRLAKRYPRYGFDSHVGYGTARHRQALQQWGACHYHRQSFKPLRIVI